MNRRGFLTGLGAVIGGLALAEAVPLGRVYSFPSNILISPEVSLRFIRAYDLKTLSFVNRIDMMYGLDRALFAVPNGSEAVSIERGRFDTAARRLLDRPEVSMFVPATTPIHLLRPAHGTGTDSAPLWKGMCVPDEQVKSIHFTNKLLMYDEAV